ATKQFLLVANYVGGSIAALPILEKGQLGAPTGKIQHVGAGTHPRQTEPHAHFINALPNGDILAVDLGLDQVLRYQLTAQGELIPDSIAFHQTAQAAGPRHYIANEKGDFIYVLNELNSTIEVVAVSNGKATLVQTISTLPEGYEGEGNCAAIKIHPNGKFLYASNRKDHHSIVVYRIHPEGTLTLVEHESTQGETPRDFEIDPTGQILLVANQATGNILSFKIDATTGALTATGFMAEVPTPVCIKFL
ncbi:MAG: lactonase family protein, partial [Saprospiraceae bacterium]|nr:lactonase family protein [Saprospiraceae bacterium]